MIENFINGNLNDAKNQAKQFKVMKIFDYLKYKMNYSWQKSRSIAIYLKNPSQRTFQDTCNVK